MNTPVFSITPVTARLACRPLFILLGLALAVMQAKAQTPAGAAFTYQGILTQSGSPGEGKFDFQFSLFNAATAGAQQGATLSKNDLQVSAGRFTVALDFSAAPFANNEARWLQIAVRPGASTGAYTPLVPRQALSPTPYAITAQTAKLVPWSALTGVPAGLANGDQDTLYTAGPGLTLGSNQFSVRFGGAGAATDVARADHGHANIYDNAAADNRFLHKAGPDSMSGAGSSATLMLLHTTNQGPALSAVNKTNAPAILAMTTSTATNTAAIYGKNGSLPSTFNKNYIPAGVRGDNSSYIGVHGVSANHLAVAGSSDLGTGVFGESELGSGVYGISRGSGSTYGGYFVGPSGVMGDGGSSAGYGGYFKSSVNRALYASGSATITQTLNTAKVAYLTPRTHYLSLPGEAFVPRTSATYVNGGNNGGAYFASGTPSSSLVAPVHLPDGAVVTELKVFFYNTTAGQIGITLGRLSLATGGYSFLALIDSSGITSGYGNKSTSSISSSLRTIDNTSFGYYVSAYATSWNGINMRVMGVRIGYTIAEAE